MNNNKKIIFMGTPDISTGYLQALISNNFKILSVFTQPPRKSGRGMKVKNSPVHNMAIKNNISVFNPEKLKEKESEIIKKLKPDLIIVMGYGLIIPEKILEIPAFGCINVHVSLLPSHRGASPIEHSILNGDKKTGITIFKIQKKLDSGPIISQESIYINRDSDRETITLQLNKIGINLMLSTLPNIFNNKINYRNQNEKNVTYAPKISSSLKRIDFFENVENIINKIRAFSPNPGAWFIYKNERIKIIKATSLLNKSQPSIILNDKFHIGCKNGVIRPDIIQREGKKIMKIDEFLKGFNFEIGQKVNE